MLSGQETLIVITVALVYGAIRLLPRFLAGPGAGISAPRLRHELDHNPALMLIDVRSPPEFDGQPGHIPGALNLPLGQLRACLAEEAFLRACRDRDLVAVCRSDARAAFAVRMLRRAGFTRARILSGGMGAWEDERYPLASGAGTDPGDTS
jgi:rhodanese-related sulfurtransferase